MNILEVQRALTKLDDNALKQEMMSPGVAPQFLVLSEMQRRQEIRNGGKAPAAGPRPSMKDEAMGIGSLPEAQGMPPGAPPQGMPPGTPPGMAPDMQPPPGEGAPVAPQAFAAGGAVRFAGGGPVVVNGQIVYPEDYDQDPNGALLAYRPPADWTFGATAPRVTRRAAPVGVPIAPGDLAAQGMGDGTRMAIPVQSLADDAAPLRIGPVGGPSITPEQADYPAGPAPGRRDGGTAATSTRPATAGLPAVAAARGLPVNMYGRNAGLLADRDASLLGTDQERADRSARIAADRGVASLPGGYREPSASGEGGAWAVGLPPATGVVAGSSGTVVASRNVAPAGTGAAAVGGDSSTPIVVQRPDSTGGNAQGGRFRDSYRDAAALMPDRLAGFDEEAKALYGRDASEARGQAGAFALMEAGLRMASSRDTRFLGAVSEGGLAGLQSYRAGLAEAKKAEREGFGARLGLASARGQQDAGILKVAEGLYGTDSRERQSERTNQTQLAIAGGNNQTTLQAGREQIAGGRANALLQAGTSLTIADLQAQVQREGRERQEAVQKYVADNPAGWTQIRRIMEMEEGPDKEKAWRSITSPGYGSAAGPNQARAQYFQALQTIEDNYKPDPLGRPEVERRKAEAMAARIAELRRTYRDVIGDEPAAPTAPHGNAAIQPGHRPH